MVFNSKLLALFLIIINIFTNLWKGSWNEWLTIPVKFRDLPVTAQLAFTVWDVYGPRKVVPVGGTTFRLFGKHKYNFLIF